jgi:hypothetical protein
MSRVSDMTPLERDDLDAYLTPTIARHGGDLIRVFEDETVPEEVRAILRGCTMDDLRLLAADSRARGEAYRASAAAQRALADAMGAGSDVAITHEHMADMERRRPGETVVECQRRIARSLRALLAGS